MKVYNNVANSSSLLILMAFINELMLNWGSDDFLVGNYLYFCHGEGDPSPLLYNRWDICTIPSVQSLTYFQAPKGILESRNIRETELLTIGNFLTVDKYVKYARINPNNLLVLPKIYIAFVTSAGLPASSTE